MFRYIFEVIQECVDPIGPRCMHLMTFCPFPQPETVRGSLIRPGNPSQRFVQDPRDATVKLKVGGTATVFQGTKVKVRCPVKKRFDK